MSAEHPKRQPDTDLDPGMPAAPPASIDGDPVASPTSLDDGGGSPPT
jgi:hypothetical protein